MSVLLLGVFPFKKKKNVVAVSKLHGLIYDQTPVKWLECIFPKLFLLIYKFVRLPIYVV